MLLEEGITYVGLAVALHQILCIWDIAKKIKSKVLDPQFHRNQDYVSIKLISRKILVPARLQLILLMDVVMRKYLSSI